jgi:filamin
MPSGKTARPHITDNKDGTITVKFQPAERGLHEMDIKYEGNHIPGESHTSYLPEPQHVLLFFVDMLFQKGRT